MGAWGEGPFDNDDAGDMVSRLMDPVRVVANPKNHLRAYRQYAEARAAARFILLAHGTDLLGGPSLETVLFALVRMRCDVEWLGSWRSPRTVAKKLDGEIEDVLEKMRTSKRRTITKLPELEATVKSASEVEVPRTRWSAKPKRRRKP